jgi:hypothetical protein
MGTVLVKGGKGGHHVPTLSKPEKVKIAPIVFSRIEIISENPKSCAERTTDEQISDILEMYKKFGWELNTPGIIIPKRQKGIDRLLIIGDQFTEINVFETCESLFRSRWSYGFNDFEELILKNERDPKNGTYAVWFRDSVEPDKKLMGSSVEDIGLLIKKTGSKTITLLERMLFELMYYEETGNHLDIKNWTVCSGSSYLDGDMPIASWCVDEFVISHDFPGLLSEEPNLGSREAVIA